jgi:hypothetical protein
MFLSTTKGRDPPKDTPARSVPQTFVCHWHGGDLVTSSLVVAAWLIGAGLSANCAAAARNGLYDLDLFTGTGILDKMPDVHDAVQTDVRRFVGRWLWFGCGRVIHGGLPSRLSGSRGVTAPAGPFTFYLELKHTLDFHAMLSVHCV